MAYELYQSRYKGFEIDAQLDKVTENATKINALSTSYDANKVMMPDNTTLPSYLANNTFDIDVSEYPGQILEKKGDGYYVPETDLSDYDTSTEVDTKIAAAAYTLPPATDTTLGGVKPDGTTITVDTDGTLHGASAIDNLDDIGDVNVSGATDGQALIYDATNEEWIPGNASGGGLPDPSAADKMLISNDSLEWEEIDKEDVGTPTWTGTQAEYDAAESDIADGTIVNITDDDGNMVGARTTEIYSTDEIIIGRWIDGKPIYRKVINQTLPSSGGMGSTYKIFIISNELSNYNIEKMITMKGLTRRSDGWEMPIPTAQTEEHSGSVRIHAHITFNDITKILNCVITTGKNDVYENQPITFIIEYTKTTDD